MEVSLRDGFLALGLAAAASARYFYQRKMLRPFQLSVIVMYPALGGALMHTVIDNSTPKTIEALKQERGQQDPAQAK